MDGVVCHDKPLDLIWWVAEKHSSSAQQEVRAIMEILALSVFYRS